MKKKFLSYLHGDSLIHDISIEKVGEYDNNFDIDEAVSNIDMESDEELMKKRNPSAQTRPSSSMTMHTQ